jgi:hypothetical protein
MRNNGDATDALVKGMPKGYVKKSLIPRLRKYAKKRLDGCIVWRSATSRGYPIISIGPGAAYVHRVLWLLTRGRIPRGVELTRKCGRKGCINPHHLQPVSYRSQEYVSEAQLSHREQSRRRMLAAWSNPEKRAQLRSAMVEGWRGRNPDGRMKPNLRPSEKVLSRRRARATDLTALEHALAK